MATPQPQLLPTLTEDSEAEEAAAARTSFHYAPSSAAGTSDAGSTGEDGGGAASATADDTGRAAEAPGVLGPRGSLVNAPGSVPRRSSLPPAAQSPQKLQQPPPSSQQPQQWQFTGVVPVKHTAPVLTAAEHPAAGAVVSTGTASPRAAAVATPAWWFVSEADEHEAAQNRAGSAPTSAITAVAPDEDEAPQPAAALSSLLRLQRLQFTQKYPRAKQM